MLVVVPYVRYTFLTVKREHNMTDQPWHLLSSVKVLDIAESAPLCGRILADLGADVIRIEPPGGCPTRGKAPFYKDVAEPEKSLFWLFYNANKRGITLDLNQKDGRALFRRLVDKADILIESFPPGKMEEWGLGYDHLARLNPGLIYTSITPFGRTGPYKDYKATDLVAMAMGGYLYLTGDPDRPPLRIGYPQAYLHAGAEAAVAALMAYYYRETTGEGQLVDVSVQESLIRTTFNAIPTWHLNGINLRRMGSKRIVGQHLTLPQMWRCKDGFVSFTILGGFTGGRLMKALGDWMKERGMESEAVNGVDWASYNFYGLTTEMVERTVTPIDQFFSLYTKEELFEGCMSRGIMLFPVCTAQDTVNDPHLAERDFWQEVEHPELGESILYPKPPFRIDGNYPSIRRRAPLIGEHNREVYEEFLALPKREVAAVKRAEHSAGGIFQGIKVVDISWALVGPWITGYLAKQGAEVIKVEDADHPDSLRSSPPYPDGRSGMNRSGYFAVVNANKKSLGLNLQHREGVEVAKRLIAWADVVVESLRPGALEKLGLGYEELRKINPDIIMLSTSMLGSSGPRAQVSGFGFQLVGQAGFVSLTGWRHRPPVTPFGPYTDTIAPRFGACALILALLHRKHTGEGVCLDVSQYEAGLQFLGPLLLDYRVNGRIKERDGNSSPCYCPHGVYPCRGDDRWVALAVTSDQEWQAFCKVVAEPWCQDTRFSTLQGRKRHEESLNQLIASWTSRYPAEEIMSLLQEEKVPAGVVQTSGDLCQDPQLAHRNALYLVEREEIGHHLAFGQGFLLSRTPPIAPRAAPCLGEHSLHICREILGMDEEKIARLIGEGVLQL